VLGKVHLRHRSPFVASDCITAVIAVILLISWATKLDPFLVIGVATIGLVLGGIQGERVGVAVRH
jgi:hypothetical protein